MPAPHIELTIEPKVNGVVRYLALAPATPNEGERFQLSFEAHFTNLAPRSVRLTRLRVSFPTAPGLGVNDIGLKTLHTASNAASFVTQGLKLGAADSGHAGRSPMDFEHTDNTVLTGTPPPTIRFEVFADDFNEPASFTYPLGRHESPVAGGAYVWMARAGDLRRGEFWKGIGANHCCGHQLYAHDLTVQYFYDIIGWSELLPGKDDKTNHHYRIWDKPVYAMADGTVEAFVNHLHDNSGPPHFPTTPRPERGNHFVLRHGTDLMVYSHFRQGSLNPALMQNGVAVKAGDFLGRAGNSGYSSRPHLHVHCVDEASGRLRPIPWQQKMVARKEETRPTGSDWLMSQRQGLAVVSTLVYPGDAAPADGREWSEWRSLGGGLAFGPGACSWIAGRLDVFVVGPSRALFHKFWKGNRWSDWEDLGGDLISKPAAVSWGLNRIDVFGRGGDNSLRHTWWDGSRWRGWEGLGGDLRSAPAVCSRRANHLDVFAVTPGGSLTHRIWNGSTWTPWEGLGGTLSADPAAVSWGDNRIDVFGRGIDGTLYQKWWDGSSWSNWEARNRRMRFGPAVGSRREKRLDVFLVAPDGALQHNIWDGSQWSRWEGLGGFLTADPAAVSWSKDRIDVFGRGADNALYHTYWEPGP